MNTKPGKRSKVFFALAIVFLFLLNCQAKRSPIKIGLVGTFTGPFSDLSIAARNGAILAAEEWNQKGGINGRPVELLIKDDKNDPLEAVKVDQELIEAGVTAIIGHMTSEMSLAAYTLVNEKKMLMVSPTSSSPIFSGKDDWFIRVVASNVEPPRRLAKYCLRRACKRVVAIISSENRAFSKPFLEEFRNSIEAEGGSLVLIRELTKQDEGAYDMVATELITHAPDSVLLVLPAFQAVRICQQIRKLNIDIPIFSSGWALTRELLTHGGRSVEQVVFAGFFDPNLRTKEMLTFKENYTKRFGVEPTSAAVYGYDACNLILSTIVKRPKAKDLKSAILETKTFQSPAGRFEIDRFGDATRPVRIITVLGGGFVTLE